MQSADVVDLIDKAWKVGGAIFERLVIHQIDGLDLIKIAFALAAQTAKPSAIRSQRLCLRPPYVPCSRTAFVGLSNRPVKQRAAGIHLVHAPGRAVQQRKNSEIIHAKEV